MIRLLIFIALVFVAALGSAWVADRPGLVTLDWQGYRIEVGLMTAVVALAAIVAVCILVWNLALFVLRSPDLVGRFFRRRRKDRGYDALSKALLALGIGDAATAARYGKDADKLLEDEPAARLLLAQSAQLAGRHEEARGRYEEMLDDARLKAVGLHGLYVEAERLGEPVAARHYAEEAAALVPGLPWAGRAVLSYQAVAGDWEKAIATLEKNYASKLVDKKTFRRHKAVLLTARAIETEDRDPDTARALAGEAHGLAPALVPAAVIAARLATRRGDIRKALKIVEATWKLSPHPDLADAYAHARTGDSALDRLKRVKALAALRAHNVEGALALARAALDAGDHALAREQLRAALRLAPTRRVFLLMADLEELENGDRGRVREWLSRAVRAPGDPAWVADGTVSETWSPVSPVDGRLDAFAWTMPPVARDTERDAVETIDDALLEALPAIPPAVVPRAEVEVVAPETEAETGVSVLEAEAVQPADAHEPEKPEPDKPEAEKPAAATGEPPEKPAAEPAVGAPVNGAAKAGPAAEAPAKQETGKPTATEGTAGGEKPARDLSRPIEFPLKHMPDDPGPDGDDEEPPTKPGYRFFN
jgi:HemY protein